MIVRLGWRDLIYAVIWFVALAGPFLAVAVAPRLFDNNNTVLAAFVAYFSTVPGAVFTVWYIGRRKQP